MARRRPTPMDVPEAVRDAVDRTVQATIGSAQLTRGRAQEAVDELVRTAEARAGAVREAVVGAFEERRPATSEDMKELRAELRRISRRLTAIERQLGEGGGAGSGAAARRSKPAASSATASRPQSARGAAKGSGGGRASGDPSGEEGGGGSGSTASGGSGGTSRAS